MTRTCSLFALFAALGGSLCTAACSDEATGGQALGQLGTLRAPLTATSSHGFVYRLRHGVLSIEGSTSATIDTEDYLDQTAASITLGAGPYTVELAPGWTLEREADGNFTPVEATLLSDALQSFAIVAHERATVVFSFQVAGEVIEVGEGDLDIVLDVHDSDGSTGAGGSAGSGGAEETEAACTDDADNDGDGLSDCQDPGCVLTEHCSPTSRKPNQWAANRHGICGIRTDHVVACSSPVEKPLDGLLMDSLSSAFDTQTTCGVTYPEGWVRCSGPASLGPFNAARYSWIGVGSDAGCTVDSFNNLTCWGPLDSINPAVGEDAFQPVEPPAVGYRHGCFVDRNGLACWGENTYGEKNRPSTSLVHPVAGGNHTCALSQEGTASCWGRNDEGQASAPSGSFVELAAGFLHTCGIRRDSSLACWGSDGAGESTPPSGNDFREIHAANKSNCARRSNGSFACWGELEKDQEISGDFLNVPVPPTLLAPQAGPWTAIVPVRINADDYPDLLYYDAATGRAVYTAGTATPGVEEIALETSYAPGFTHVIPVSNSEDSALTDLTFYDSVSGNYTAMLATGTPGVQVELYSGTGTPGFTSVVPMSMDGDSITDAFWYNATTGTGILSASMGASRTLDWGAGWTTILPMHLNAGPDTDLLFYNRTTGEVSIGITLEPAKVQPKAPLHANFGPGWTSLVPIDLNGDHLTDLMRYDASTGKAVYSAASAEGYFDDLRATQELPGLTLFAPMPSYREPSRSFVAAFGND